MATQIFYTAEMEDGKTFDAVVDQRDIARYEIQPFAKAFGESPVTFSRFVTWAALNRTGKTKQGWETWNDKCLEVVDTPESEGKDK